MNSTGSKWQIVMKDPRENSKIETEEEKMIGPVGAPPVYIKTK